MNFTISYLPHSAPQREFHRLCESPEKRVIALLSGIRFGKTWAGRAQLARWILSQRGGSPMAWIVGPDYKIASKAAREFRNMMEPLIVRVSRGQGAMEMQLRMPAGLVGRTPERYYTVHVRSAKNPKGFVAEEVQWIWMDEGALCPDEAYENCLGRILHTGGKLMITSTPSALDERPGYAWIKSRVVDAAESDPTIGVVFARTEENPSFQTPEGRASLETLRKKYGPELAARLLDGKFVATSSLLIPEFDFSRHTVPPFELPEVGTPGLEIFAGIDFGVADPSAVVYYATMGKFIYGVDEIFVMNRGPEEFAQIIRSHPLHHRCVAYYADYHGSAERDVLRRRGIETWPGHAEHASTYGFLRDLLRSSEGPDGSAKLRWFDHCRNTIREMMNCRVPNAGLHKVRNNHCIDATRYALYTHLVGRPSAPSAAALDRLAPFRRVPRHYLPPSIERAVYGSVSEDVVYLEKPVERWTKEETYGNYGEARYSDLD